MDILCRGIIVTSTQESLWVNVLEKDMDIWILCFIGFGCNDED